MSFFLSCMREKTFLKFQEVSHTASRMQSELNSTQFVPALVILQFMMGNAHLTAECMILRESKKFKVGIPLGCVTGDLLQSGQVVVNAAIHCSSSTCH